MYANVFLEKGSPPDDRSILKSLGATGKYWTQIREYVSDTFGPVSEEWKYYGAKYGWGMKTLLKKRNLFFFTAGDGGFRIGFVFGDKAVKEIKRSDLPEKIVDEVKNAKKYVEGTGLRLIVKDSMTAGVVRKLIRIKVEN